MEITENLNIKAILRMNGYLRRLFHSYSLIYNTFTFIIDDLIKLQNELNFKSPDGQLIESYNKSVTFLYDQLSGILSEKISDGKFLETFVIKPVNFDKGQFTHKLEVSYFLCGNVCLEKPIGTVSNVSINMINDHVKLYRSNDTFDFVFIDNSLIITADYFRDHVNKCIVLIKNLISWFYNDIDFTKMAFRSLLNIMSEAVKSSNDDKKWVELYTEVKTSADDIFKITKEIDIFD